MTYEENYWETKNGEKIKICDMEIDHIKNTINYLKKHTDFYDISGGGFDIDSMYYEDNSYLVEKKIKELQYELNKRK